VTTRRTPIVLALLAVLVAAGLVDRNQHQSRAEAVPRLEPHAARLSALSSTWYCTGATAAPGSPADGTVMVLNASTRALHGSVTFIPNQGDSRQVDVDVPASSRIAVRAQDVLAAPFVSAIVDLDGGQAVAETVANGPLGPSVSPCASSAARLWYFAEGVTTRDATEIITVLNPFPEDAIIDVSFNTEDGRVAPEPLAGMVVKGRGMTAVNVGDFAHRRQVVAATIVARIGRVVTGRLQSFDGTAGRKGITMALGAPGTGQRWYFPEGLVVDGLTERFQIFNPARREVAIEMSFALEKSDAEPLRLRIPPESRLTVTANSEARIPKGVPHATTIRGLSGDSVVAERTVDAAVAGRTGVAWTLGAQTASRRWAFAAGAADESVDEWVTVQNPGPRPVVLSIGLLSDGQAVGLDGLQRVTLAGRQRMAWRIGDRVKKSATPLVVAATQPVVVERGLYFVKTPGTAMTAGIALE
jgi:hypothetical protein